MLYLGDCLEVMNSQILDKSIDLIFCDLPYGITQNTWDSIIPLDKLWKSYQRILKSNGIIVLTAVQPFASSLVSSNYNLFRYDIVWKKNIPTGFLNANKMPLRAHEHLLVFYEKCGVYNKQITTGHKPQHSFTKKQKEQTLLDGTNYGKTKPTSNSGGQTTRNPISIIEISTIGRTSKERVGHPTQKPIALAEYVIKTYTNPGMTVLDNCLGSGTTAIVCDNLQRNWIGIELNPTFYEIALTRINKNRINKGMKCLSKTSDGLSATEEELINVISGSTNNV